MEAYLGNLSGWEAIIGRSIHISKVGEPIPVACCTIGADKNPHAEKAKKQYVPKYTAAYAPGYGYYNGAGA